MKNTNAGFAFPARSALSVLCLVLLALALPGCAASRAKKHDNPELVAAYMDSARFYSEQGKIRSAYRYYKKVYKKYPMNASSGDALFSMAGIDLKRGRNMKSYELYDTFLVKYPQSDNYAAAVSEMFKIGNLFLGKQRSSGKFKSSAMRKAAKIFDNLQQRAMDNDMSVKALYNCGIANYRVENYQTALDSLERIPAEETNIKDDVCYLVCRCYYELAVIGRNNQIPVNNALKMIPSYVEKIDSPAYRDEISGMLDKVKELKAKHYAGIARYYDKTKHHEAAELYRRKILTEFSATQVAAKVREKQKVK